MIYSKEISNMLIIIMRKIRKSKKGCSKKNYRERKKSLELSGMRIQN